VLELLPGLAECEDAVCHERDGSAKLLATLLEELRHVQTALRDEMCSCEGIQEICKEVLAKGKVAENLYNASYQVILANSPSDTLDKYQRVSAELEAKVLANALACKQVHSSLSALYEEAVAVRTKARVVMESLSTLSNAELKPMAALKRMSRASEKVVLQPSGADGAMQICDIVRDMFVCDLMEDVIKLLALIAGSPAIQLVRFKNRFTNPSGGWRDAMLNYRVHGSTHICEVQVSHRKMILQREAMGGHGAYGRERNASELLEFLEQ